MNTFIWTDEMVKDVCKQVAKQLFARVSDEAFDAIINAHKNKHTEGTFENKVYWRVNLDNLCISPVSEIPPIPDGDRYFTTYPEAGNYVTQILTKNLFNNA
jgi:hypothetical protein